MTNETNLTFRQATQADLPAIVRMLADDKLGVHREAYQDPLPASYYDAFAAIDRDPNQQLIVACLAEQVIGTLQLTFIPSLSYQGSWRALLESVRIDAPYRNRGFGKQLVQYALAQSQTRGCYLAQLATNKQRSAARRFYEQLGFDASHEGMKRVLS
jgi:GNAT superfamily N-acetyltransferase